MDDELKGLLIGIAVVLLGLSILFIGTKEIEIHFIDNVPTECYVNGKLIYEGPSVGIEVDSSGANTTVTTKGGFLYLFPRSYYVSKDVRLIGKK